MGAPVKWLAAFACLAIGAGLHLYNTANWEHPIYVSQLSLIVGPNAETQQLVTVLLFVVAGVALAFSAVADLSKKAGRRKKRR